jgi:hypothetical protein
MLERFIVFYNKTTVDKTDLDNLLKNNEFSKQFENEIKELVGVSDLKELINGNEYNS